MVFVFLKFQCKNEGTAYDEAEKGVATHHAWQPLWNYLWRTMPVTPKNTLVPSTLEGNSKVR